MDACKHHQNMFTDLGHRVLIDGDILRYAWNTCREYLILPLTKRQQTMGAKATLLSSTHDHLTTVHNKLWLSITIKIILLTEEILHHLGCTQNCVNNGTNYQPQLVIAGFLDHQHYLCQVLWSDLIALHIISPRRVVSACKKYHFFCRQCFSNQPASCLLCLHIVVRSVFPVDLHKQIPAWIPGSRSSRICINCLGVKSWSHGPKSSGTNHSVLVPV